MEKSTKAESTSTIKKKSIEWTPILMEIGVIAAKGVITGMSYKAGESLYKYAFTSKPKGDLKLLDDYRKVTSSIG